MEHKEDTLRSSKLCTFWLVRSCARFWLVCWDLCTTEVKLAFVLQQKHTYYHNSATDLNLCYLHRSFPPWCVSTFTNEECQPTSAFKDLVNSRIFAGQGFPGQITVNTPYPHYTLLSGMLATGYKWESWTSVSRFVCISPVWTHSD